MNSGVIVLVISNRPITPWIVVKLLLLIKLLLDFKSQWKCVHVRLTQLFLALYSHLQFTKPNPHTQISFLHIIQTFHNKNLKKELKEMQKKKKKKRIVTSIGAIAASL